MIKKQLDSNEAKGDKNKTSIGRKIGATVLAFLVTGAVYLGVSGNKAYADEPAESPAAAQNEGSDGSNIIDGSDEVLPGPDVTVEVPVLNYSDGQILTDPPVVGNTVAPDGGRIAGESLKGDIIPPEDPVRPGGQQVLPTGIENATEDSNGLDPMKTAAAVAMAGLAVGGGAFVTRKKRNRETVAAINGNKTNRQAAFGGNRR